MLSRIRHKVSRWTTGSVATLALYAGAMVIFGGMYLHLKHLYSVQAVRSAAAQVSGALLQVESGQRGYLLTANDAYLNNYRFYRTVLHYRLEALCKLIPMNLENHNNCKRLDELITKKLAEMETTVHLARLGRVEAALQIVRTDVGLHWMTEIQNHLDEIRTENAGELHGCLVE